MKVRDILNKDVFVYVLDFYKLKEDEVPNKIYKCKVNLKYEEWDRSRWGEEIPTKHIQGTIRSSKNPNFRNNSTSIGVFAPFSLK